LPKGDLEAFENVKSTHELELSTKNMDGVNSAKISHFVRDSIDYPTIALIVIGIVSVGIQIAKFIYGINQNRSQSNKCIQVNINNTTVNFNSCNSKEEIQKKLDELIERDELTLNDELVEKGLAKIARGKEISCEMIFVELE